MGSDTGDAQTALRNLVFMVRLMGTNVQHDVASHTGEEQTAPRSRQTDPSLPLESHLQFTSQVTVKCYREVKFVLLVSLMQLNR